MRKVKRFVTRSFFIFTVSLEQYNDYSFTEEDYRDINEDECSNVVFDDISDHN